MREFAVITRTNAPTSVADEFIAEGVEGEENDLAPRAAVNARLNLERELNDQDLAKIAADFDERYRRTAVRYTGDMSEVPQRLLMPSVHDANLWQVRVKVRRSVNSILRNFLYLTTLAWKRAGSCLQSNEEVYRPRILEPPDTYSLRFPTRLASRYDLCRSS